MVKKLRHISFVTSSRSDFGIMAPLMAAIRNEPDFELSILATGAHFSAKLGMNINEVREYGFLDEVVELPVHVRSMTPIECSSAIGKGTEVFAEHLSRHRPDLLIIPGDRFDALPAGIAAIPLNIAVAHISGGEVTEGAMDDIIRHLLTKLSHIHFPAHSSYGDRIVQMGEEPWRVKVVGEPGLDRLKSFEYESRSSVFSRFGLNSKQPLSVFTYHPETVGISNSRDAIIAILDAAKSVNTQIVFTYPNGDPGSNEIIEALKSYVSGCNNARLYPSLGRSLYLSLINQADVMVGNSSSGIIEAASFKLPVVTIGDRQKGRIAGPNIISVSENSRDIEMAWKQALTPDFRRSLKDIKNPYGAGNSIERIIQEIKLISINERLLVKRFHDQAASN